MNRKEYSKPVMQVVSLQQPPQLLAGVGSLQSTNFTWGEIAGSETDR